MFCTDDVNVARLKKIFPEVTFAPVSKVQKGDTVKFKGQIAEGMCLRIDAIDRLIELGYDKAIYMDADALLMKDPQHLFGVPVSFKNRFAAVMDMAYLDVPEFKDAYPHVCCEWSHRQSISERYFNSGVMVISLKGLSEYLSLLDEPSVTSYVLKNQRRYLFPDQDPLNELGDGWLELGRKYNAFPDYVIVPNMLASEAMLLRHDISNSTIIHWTTTTKPWVLEDKPTMVSAVMPHEKYWDAMQPVLEHLDGGFVKAVAIKLRQFAHLEEHTKRDFADVGGFNIDNYLKMSRGSTKP